MAAPATASVKDLNGKWVMNKQASGDFDGVLSLQGVGFLTRKTIGLATITLHLKEYTEGDVTHIDIDQVLTGGIKGTSEARTLDNSWRGHTDHIFGEVRGRSTFTAAGVTEAEGLDDEDKKFLGEGWAPGVDEVVESYVENEKAGWKAIQHWGFEEIAGERKYVRHTIVWNKKDKKRIKLVYDYAGPL